MLPKLHARLRAVHARLGTAGFVIAVIALIAALAGTAFAAAGLNSKQKKEVKSIAKQFAGKQGPAGPAGPAGSQGAKGDTGAEGAKGDTGAEGPQGKPGTNGTNGLPGKSVEVAPESPGSNCTEGGVGVTVEGASTTEFVCNGEDGETGFTEFLPSGKTETGNWSGWAKNLAETGAVGGVSISFNIPLESAPTLTRVAKAGNGTTCPGIVNGVPKAEPGTLCLYEEAIIGETPTFNAFPAGKTGAFIAGACPKECLWKGVWAVTAP